MTEKEINKHLASLIILLHEGGYELDFVFSAGNTQVIGISGMEPYAVNEAELSLISMFYNDQDGISAAIYAVSTSRGEKGILLTRDSDAKRKKSGRYQHNECLISPMGKKDRKIYKYIIKRCLGTLLIVSAFVSISLAQVSGEKKGRLTGITDSVTVSVHAAYNTVSNVHRWLFGENYRREWAMPVKLPLLHLSQINGGLKPIREGGGMQSKALRLRASDGQEWVVRSVEKVPDKLLPPGLLNTFVVDWVGDEFSAQHPFSALVVPPMADAVNVPHANPVIGVVADDPELGEYRKNFAGLVCLLEEREPMGHSEATIRVEGKLVKSYYNRLDGERFLRARMLDLLLGDWDRHEDQWRFSDSTVNGITTWTGVPRDRDQVFHLAEGVFPSIASLPWLDPTLEHFEGNIPRVKWSLYKTRFIKAFPDQQLPYERWMQLANEFVQAESDQVLENALRRLPKELYALRHDVLFEKLKSRRDRIPHAMNEYYHFVNRITDLRLTAKSEVINFTDGRDAGLVVTVHQAKKDGDPGDPLWRIHYQAGITRELRLYTSGGADQINIHTPNSRIKLRIVDSTGESKINLSASSRKINLYGPESRPVLSGLLSRLKTHFSGDTMNNRFVPTNLYNIWMPLVTAGLNSDDGFMLGLGFKYKGVDGFRKLPYATTQSLLLTHAFASDAFRIQYAGEWIGIVGKADFILKADLQGPANKINFLGIGNETILNRTGDFHHFYRARYDLYNIIPAIRWHTGQRSDISAGLSVQHYRYGTGDNSDRFIGAQQSRRLTYDSLTIGNIKTHLGIAINFITDHRNNTILPGSGYFFSVDLTSAKGISNHTNSYIQVRPEFTYYQKLNSRGSVVLWDRVGGGLTLGKPAFYQALYLGGQGNLLGYLKYRFAGQHMLFNNLQARMKLLDVASYILPGQLGLTGFYDIGRVWANGETSERWHQGTGGGIYFAPAGLTVLNILAGHSREGWYPYISLNFRL